MKFKIANLALCCLLVACFAIAAPGEASAKPEFFTQSCLACHADDTPTCDGCHKHGLKNLTATTDVDQYQPGQTVTVLLGGGSRGGYVGARLYNDSAQEVDRVTGPTGTGDDGGQNPALEFPMTLSAPAPITPGLYTWSASWYGSPNDSGNPGTYPHVEEFVPTNQFEVLGASCADADGDGYEDSACNPSVGAGGGDCDDTNPLVNPGVAEICGDGLDNDCDGLYDGNDPDCVVSCADVDGDGYEDSACNPSVGAGGGDCDDANPLVNPGMTEVCGDGLDNDCDGLYDGNDPDCATGGMTGINCAGPANESILYAAPTFGWSARGGANNGFAVDLSLDWTFGSYFSTFNNLRQIINGNSWAMPDTLWNAVPSGSYVYWRVRGADMAVTPVRIMNSDEVWWFYKP